MKIVEFRILDVTCACLLGDIVLNNITFNVRKTNAVVCFNIVNDEKRLMSIKSHWTSCSTVWAVKLNGVCFSALLLAKASLGVVGPSFSESYAFPGFGDGVFWFRVLGVTVAYIRHHSCICRCIKQRSADVSGPLCKRENFLRERQRHTRCNY